MGISGFKQPGDHKPQQILVRLRGEEDIIWLCNIGSIPIYVYVSHKTKKRWGEKNYFITLGSVLEYFFYYRFLIILPVSELPIKGIYAPGLPSMASHELNISG